MFEFLGFTILWIIFLYSAGSVIYLFTLSLAGRIFYNKKFYAPVLPVNRVAILVPAYKEDGIIVSTAANLSKLDYPDHLYDVFIIADSFQTQTLEELKTLPVSVIPVSFPKSTKTRAINKAFEHLGDDYDIALICDADNMLARDFLKKIDAAFQNGASAVQGQRVAKNLDSSFAILDAASEGINNTIFRRGSNAVGLSSSVIGSGMAFPFQLLRRIMAQINAVGGFDKILQLRIVEKRIHIHYLDNALIFDEKVESSQAFQQQRKRWVSSQFIYLKQFFFPALVQLLKGNLSYFNLAIMHNLILPRAFLLVLLPLLTLICFLVGLPWGSTAAFFFVLYIASLVIAIPPQLLNRDFVNALKQVPRAVVLMIATIFGMKKANKTFIHTVHTKTEITNPLFKDHANEPIL